MIELFHNDMSTCAQKVRCQLAQKGLEWQSHIVDLRAGEQNSPSFIALNPKAVVPVLVHDGGVVTESNIIMEYIEDAFPDRPSLRPESPGGKANMRSWMQELDVHLHLDIVPLSAVAIRIQILAMNNTPEALEAFYESMPDPKTRAIRRDLIENGAESAPFKGAFNAWLSLIKSAETALQNNDYLSSDAPSLADFAILPYITRLDHLQLGAMWADKPRFEAWFQRMTETEGYRIGIESWLNPKYLELMKTEGAKIDVDRLLSE